MAHEEKKSLIFRLYQAIGGTKEEEPERYNEGTNSLYSEPRAVPSSFQTLGEQDSRHHTIMVEDSFFSQIVNENYTAMTRKNENYMVGHTITFREHKNFKATGRVTVKEITCVIEGGETGAIRPGYCVICWK